MKWFKDDGLGFSDSSAPAPPPSNLSLQFCDVAASYDTEEVSKSSAKIKCRDAVSSLALNGVSFAARAG
jgi:hypothetical protein